MYDEPGQRNPTWYRSILHMSSGAQNISWNTTNIPQDICFESLEQHVINLFNRSSSMTASYALLNIICNIIRDPTEDGFR